MKIINIKILILIILLLAFSFIVYLTINYTDLFDEKNTAQSIYKSCLVSMKNNNCSIMLGPQSIFLNAKDNQVLIVGVGKVDATIYRQFRDNPLMCYQIKASCQSDINSPICHLAKSLYQSE